MELSRDFQCPVCIETYSATLDANKPVFLPCFHSICRTCSRSFIRDAQVYQNVQDRRFPIDLRQQMYHHPLPVLVQPSFPCPTCRADIPSPPNGGFPVNFYIVNFLEKESSVAETKREKLQLWCRSCNKIAEVECKWHETEKLSQAIVRLSTSHRHLSTVLSGVVEDNLLMLHQFIVEEERLDPSSPLREAFTKLRSFISNTLETFSEIHKAKQNLKKKMEKSKSNLNHEQNTVAAQWIKEFSQNSDMLCAAHTSSSDPTKTPIAKLEAHDQSTQVDILECVEASMKTIKQEENNINDRIAQFGLLKDTVAKINPSFLRNQLGDLLGELASSFDCIFSEVNHLQQPSDVDSTKKPFYKHPFHMLNTVEKFSPEDPVLKNFFKRYQ